MCRFSDFPPGEIFHHFLNGQRQMLACTDSQIPSHVFDQIDQLINKWSRRDEEGVWQFDEEVPTPAVIRYLRGEFTNGVVPREYPPHQEAIFNNLFTFLVIMERLALEVDGEKAELPKKKKKPATVIEQVNSGKYFPVIQYNGPEGVATYCVFCNKTVDVELFAARIKGGTTTCPHCKRGSHE